MTRLKGNVSAGSQFLDFSGQFNDFPFGYTTVTFKPLPALFCEAVCLEVKTKMH